jgi:hypothetical protein
MSSNSKLFTFTQGNIINLTKITRIGRVKEESLGRDKWVEYTIYFDDGSTLEVAELPDLSIRTELLAAWEAAIA